MHAYGGGLVGFTRLKVKKKKNLGCIAPTFSSSMRILLQTSTCVHSLSVLVQTYYRIGYILMGFVRGLRSF